jgi:transcriptional regulator with XRE-family HTH domain
MRRERERRGWTQAELATKLAEVGVNLHPSAIAKIELRDVTRPRAIRLDEAQAIAYLLGLPLEEMARTSIDRFDDLMIYLGQTLIRMRDDATTVNELTREAETQLATMDAEAAQALAEEHFVVQLTALARALPLEQLNEYVSLLLNPAHPFHGVISAAARESRPGGQRPETS